MKTVINNLLKLFNLKITSNSFFEEIIEKQKPYLIYQLARKIDESLLIKYFQNIENSKSELAQDLFVLSELNFKYEGFFVEFGATNGVDISNSYLLEKFFSWQGILSEPARKWHQNLKKNRNAHIETNCVWTNSNSKIIFNETLDGEFSTIDKFSNSDEHKFKRKKKNIKYEVETISLNDLLKKYNAPAYIDYLSIDTEGSEFEILKSFDFSKYKFRIITCEHNYNSNRNKIYQLLTSNGYKRKFEELSQYDDWYVVT